MASVLSLAARYQFYPIGNTTAVCLTRDLPPDVPANILLLPCGDPRNILYTLFCEKSNRLRKSLDFTCCDHDPGILARNVLLFTMIIDRIATSTMWNIFFHMCIDIESCSILVSQSQKLATYDSVEAWRSSPYGSVIRLGTGHTFAELRRHWELYGDFYHPSKLDRFQTLQKIMDNRRREQVAAAPEVNLFSIHSSGLLFMNDQAISLCSEVHRRYWQTGSTFTDTARITASTYPNSTFLFSFAGEGFNVSPKTDPIIPFPSDSLFGNAGKRNLTVKDLVDFAQSQFIAWCSAFQSAAQTQNLQPALVTIRFILGDGLAVARALRDFLNGCNCPGVVQGPPFAAPRVAPWSALPMELNREEYADLGAPLHFDAIDTSNVSDYIGFLNLFLATAPLLTRSSSAVLYTESFGLLFSDPIIELEATLFASLSAVAVLVDLAPVDALSGFISTCNTHELVMSIMGPKDKDIHQQRLTWKRPSSCDPSACPDGGPRVPVSFDTHQLAKLLHNIYLDLFRSEDQGPAHLPTVDKAVKERNNAMARALLQGVVVCPSRESFVAFLSFIHASLWISEEQWSDIVRAFLDLRSQDQPFFDKLRDSDVHTQLHRYGLHTIPCPSHIYNPSTEAEPRRLSFWPTIPSLIRVFLTVPRTELAKLERGVAGTKVPFNVWIHGIIDVGHDQDPHIFQSVDVEYGTLIDTGTAAAPNLSFREDPEGYRNGADLVFSFVVPSYVLTEARAAMVRLQVRNEPKTVSLLLSTLGPEMCIFSANVEDNQYVHLLPEPSPPLPSGSQPTPPTRMTQSTDRFGAIGYQPPVRVGLDSTGRNIASLTATLEITNAAAQAAFTRGAMPSVRQCSPCAVQVVFGDLTQTLAYPVPIAGSQRELRLVPKSSYIEVVVPVAIPFLEPDGMKVNQFPVVHANGSLVPWNFHRVFLDQLPVLDRANVSEDDLDEWYVTYISWQNSRRERMAFYPNPNHCMDPLVNVKMTLSGIMMTVAGIQGSAFHVFALKHRAAGAADTFLFADKTRYDDAAHTMLLDAFVFVATKELAPHVSQAILRLSKSIMFVPVHGGEQEMCAWKRLLPAAAERCRATWTHGANCEYRVVQPDGSVRWQVPRALSNAEGQGDPLCGCGRGKDVEGMMADPVWRMLGPFVTRIALSPMFGVSHVEEVMEPLEVMLASESFLGVDQLGLIGTPTIGSSLSAASVSRCP